MNFTDQFYNVDTYSPGPLPRAITVENLEIVDVNGDGQIGTGDTIGGQVIDGVYTGDTVTVRNAQGTDIVYTGTSYSVGGRFIFTPTDPNAGQILVDGTLLSTQSQLQPVNSVAIADFGPPCYVADTRIDTPQGPVPVECLQAGDLITTADRGAIPLRAVHMRQIDTMTLIRQANTRPVRIRKGALGNGLPKRDTFLSPQHRVLLRSRIVERMYQHPEILACAAQLTRMAGIDRVQPSEAVTYVHLVFDAHHIVYAEGTPMESLLLGPHASQQFSPAQLNALVAAVGAPDKLPTRPVRPLAKGAKLNQCLARHMKNGVELIAVAPEAQSIAA